MPKYVINEGTEGEITMNAANAKRDGNHMRFYNTQGLQMGVYKIDEIDSISPEVYGMKSGPDFQ